MEAGQPQPQLLVDPAHVSHLLLGLLLLHLLDADISGTGTRLLIRRDEILGYGALCDWRLRQFIRRIGERLSHHALRTKMGPAPYWGRGIADGRCFTHADG